MRLNFILTGLLFMVGGTLVALSTQDTYIGILSVGTILFGIFVIILIGLEPETPQTKKEEN